MLNYFVNYFPKFCTPHTPLCSFSRNTAPWLSLLHKHTPKPATHRPGESIDLASTTLEISIFFDLSDVLVCQAMVVSFGIAIVMICGLCGFWYMCFGCSWFWLSGFCCDCGFIYLFYSFMGLWWLYGGLQWWVCSGLLMFFFLCR